jgi:hypothetical protein
VVSIEFYLTDGGKVNVTVDSDRSGCEINYNCYIAFKVLSSLGYEYLGNCEEFKFMAKFQKLS